MRAQVKVDFLGKAREKVRADLIPRLKPELRDAFPGATSIMVYDCFEGYTRDQDNKIVLGGEVRSRDAYHTHVVKLGNRRAVACDHDGWRKCLFKNNFSSRA